MSIQHPTERDYQTAGLYGMDPRIDTDVAEGIGIPSTPETYAQHLASGREVAALSVAAISKRAVARRADHAVHATNNRLTGVMTPEEAAAQQEINARRPAMPWEKPRQK